jgi:hypothetical protein
MAQAKKMAWVKMIYSASEADCGAGFWSNNYGWTVKSCATKFTEAESKEFVLPASLNNDAEWIDY